MAGFSEVSLEEKALEILVDELGFPAESLTFVPEGMSDNVLKMIIQAVTRAVYRELTEATYDNPCQASDEA